MREESSSARELSFDDLEDVIGGAAKNRNANTSKKKELCPKCNEMTFFKYYSGGRAVCTSCKAVMTK